MPVKVAISQPLFLPWVGTLELVRNADAFVHYDDVQFSKGSFTNRVQIKEGARTRWLSLPLRRFPLGSKICEVEISPRQDWRDEHLSRLRRAYSEAPFGDEMMSLAQRVYGFPDARLDRLVIHSMEQLLAYFGLDSGRTFQRSSEMDVPGRASERVLASVKALGGDTYVTAHGARKYLDHQAMEDAGVQVVYVDYEMRPYPQGEGEFTPYVSALDLVANLGPDGRDWICSSTVGWREFLARD